MLKTFMNTKKLFTRNLKLCLRKRIVKHVVWSVAVDSMDN